MAEECHFGGSPGTLFHGVSAEGNSGHRECVGHAAGEVMQREGKQVPGGRPGRSRGSKHRKTGGGLAATKAGE